MVMVMQFLTMSTIMILLLLVKVLRLRLRLAYHDEPFLFQFVDLLLSELTTSLLRRR